MPVEVKERLAVIESKRGSLIEANHSKKGGSLVEANLSAAK